jgi:RNA polymerase sigma-70 factor (ECF subfamily)
MEDNIMFQAMIQELSEKNRIVMALYYGDSYTIREISQILEISEDAVKNRLSRGRKEVLKFL